jgi:integrase
MDEIPKLKMDDMPNPILKANIRIFRPFELKEFIECIAKENTRIVFKAALYSAMRYAELYRVFSNRKWFDERTSYITLPRGEDRKVLRQQCERSIRLNPIGVEVFHSFLQLDSCPNHHQYWCQLQTAIKRFSEKGYNPIGITPKSTRKTYVSYLVNCFPDKLLYILLSVGHSQEMSINHYLGLAFRKIDQEQIKTYVEGWI